jgi:hypothetical protein
MTEFRRRRKRDQKTLNKEQGSDLNGRGKVQVMFLDISLNIGVSGLHGRIVLQVHGPLY